jgi:hypothetical protein
MVRSRRVAAQVFDLIRFVSLLQRNRLVNTLCPVRLHCSNTVSEYAIGTGGLSSALGTLPTGSGPNAVTADY